MFSFPNELYNNVSHSQKHLVTLCFSITLLMFYSRGGGDLDCLLYSSLIFSVEITEQATSPVTSTVPPTPTSGSNQKEKKKKKKDPSKGRWVEGITSEGYHYYYDLITGGKSIRQKTVENTVVDFQLILEYLNCGRVYLYILFVIIMIFRIIVRFRLHRNSNNH